ncbi:AAA family ATPase [bacterium]|nr:AAA family ATPase [bacterium]NIO73585.1 AAA family ATPase [bacterium]
MPTFDLIYSLAHASLHSSSERIANAIRQIVAHERKINRKANATRLERLLNESNRIAPLKVMDGLVERKPKKRLIDLILTAENLTEIHHLVEEHQRAALLLSRGLEPRHKILLIGPPGNGKTSLAEAIASELGLPLYVIDYAQVIGSLLGETTARLKKVFEFASREPCVLFFDEFDTIGKERGDGHETGEIKRVVASLLLYIDALPSTTIAICATNHQELLDRAAGRRFDLCLMLDIPTECQADVFINALGEIYRFDLEPYKKRIPRHSFSDIEKRCLDFMRKELLKSAEKCA